MNATSKLTIAVLSTALLFGGLVLIAVFLVWQKLAQPVPQAATGLADYHLVHRFDPMREGGHLLPNLNSKVVGELPHVPVRFITNSKGFRNEQEFSYLVPEKTFRILFLGDSFVDGMRTDQRDTIGAVMERNLQTALKNDSFDEVEVMISGHNNPVNAWYYFQEHGYKFSPHLVILGVTLGNDLTWHSYRTSFNPAIDDAGLAELRFARGGVQTGSEKPELLLPEQAYSAPSFWDTVTEYELKVRRFLELRSGYFDEEVPPMLGPMENKRRQVYAGGFFTSLGLFYQPVMPEIAVMYEDFEQMLKGLSARVTARGGKFLVTLFPLRMQVSESEWRMLVRFYSLDDAKFDLNYPNDLIARNCQRYNIDCVDLHKDFVGYSTENAKSLFRARGDMHFNERGQKLAGEVLAAHVYARYLGSGSAF